MTVTGCQTLDHMLIWLDFKNASSLAIEQELAGHPDVLEVSVVARPHPKWGERVS